MKPDCDLLVLGGGISGAGVALEAARRGLRVTLVEARDYAWGASSRSSKLVHGGLRYLQSGALHLTRESVQEREALLRELPGLVERIGFVMAHRRPFGPGRRTMQIGLRLYDHLAGRRARGWASNADIPWLVPGLATDDGASLYEDATTDDARLTLRVLQEARSLGAELHNHTTLTALQRDAQGQICGATLRDPDGFERHLACRCIVSASGPWLGTVAALAGATPPRLRPLRGSHLLLPLWRLPLARAVAWRHPEDGRPVFAYPWQGRLIVGTTDLDHPDLGTEPRIQPEELRYLLAALAHSFPRAGVTAADVQCTWAGVRPVIASDQPVAPSQESREHLVWAQDGLVALAGGKLTTFRRMAQAALAAARPWLPALPPPVHRDILPAHAPVAGVPLRWQGRWGALAGQAARGALIPGTTTRWGELRHSLLHEQVRHLDDLLLRRSRLGLLMPGFAADLLPALQPLCQETLGWSAEHFRQERDRYLDRMTTTHGVPA